jgi:hypothetical protein
MDLKKLTNRRLVELLAKEHGHNDAWKEFLDRFHKFVCYTIYKECQRLGYQKGARECEDTALAVYEKLLKDNSQVLKDFRCEYENAVYKFLQIIAIRIVINKCEHDHAQSFYPPGGWLSSDELASLGIVLKDPDDTTGHSDLKDEIIFCLKRILRDSRNPKRDMSILRTHFFELRKPEEIVSHLRLDLSSKRVTHIIEDNTKKLRKCLRERGIGGG